MGVIKVTEADVLANMQDVSVCCIKEFGRPITHVAVRMKNGFIVRESVERIDPRLNTESQEKQICLGKIKSRVYELLRYGAMLQATNGEKVQYPNLKKIPCRNILREDAGGNLRFKVNKFYDTLLDCTYENINSENGDVVSVEFDQNIEVHSIAEMKDLQVYVMLVPNHKPQLVQIDVDLIGERSLLFVNSLDSSSELALDEVMEDNIRFSYLLHPVTKWTTAK